MLRLHRLEVARRSASATHVCHAAWDACSLDLPLSGNRRYGWQYTLRQAHVQPLAVACSCIGGAYAASREPACCIDCLLRLIRQVNQQGLHLSGWGPLAHACAGQRLPKTVSMPVPTFLAQLPAGVGRAQQEAQAGPAGPRGRGVRSGLESGRLHGGLRRQGPRGEAVEELTAAALGWVGCAPHPAGAGASANLPRWFCGDSTAHVGRPISSSSPKTSLVRAWCLQTVGVGEYKPPAPKEAIQSVSLAHNTETHCRAAACRALRKFRRQPEARKVFLRARW